MNHGLQKDVWILVCDGRKALLLQNAGDWATPKLECRKVFEHPDLPTHALGTDAPGRTISSKGGGRRSATEAPDLHTLAEEHFLKEIVAAHVNREVLGGHIKKMILVAPARALGVVRHALSPAAHAVMQAEIDKDYVRTPIPEIERHLAHALAEQTGK